LARHQGAIVDDVSVVAPAAQNRIPGRNVMKSFSFLLAGALGMASATDVALAQTSKPGIERRYIIDCGTSVGPISHAGLRAPMSASGSTWSATAI